MELEFMAYVTPETHIMAGFRVMYINKLYLFQIDLNLLLLIAKHTVTKINAQCLSAQQICIVNGKFSHMMHMFCFVY